MINKKEIDLKVSEICSHVPELVCLRYKEIIGEVYLRLRKNNVYLLVKQGCDRSDIQWVHDNSVLKPYLIKLGVSNYFCKSVLWDLVHELGHLLIFDFGRKVPEPKPWWLMLPRQRCARNKGEAQLQLNNEEAAWDTGEKWLKEKFTLREDEWDDFNSRRKLCLDTYKGKVEHFGNR